MSIAAKLYANGDDCFLAWHMPPTEDCLGFAIHRTLKRAADGQTVSGYIHNRVGFAGEPKEPHETRPSTEWPFQRYTWTDHGVSAGDVVSYRIAPVIAKGGGLAVDEDAKVEVGPLKVTPKGGGNAEAHFNRGIILSQFVARQLGPGWDKSSLVKLKKELGDAENELRDFLAGDLGARLLALLDEAKEKGWHVYAALYELHDEELIGKLVALGKRAHVVLSNGSSKKKGTDGNKEARKALKGKVDLTDRMLWSKGLGHNKFVVFEPEPNKPLHVWTGSMNWAPTGMCTQINNGLLVEQRMLAQVFKDHWKLLRSDKPPHFGDTLLDSNDKVKQGGTSGLGKWSVWFTRTREGADLEDVSDLINGAKDAILFLMFEPGKSGLLQVVQARLSPASKTFDPNLYIHGVVNTISGAAGKENVEVDLVRRGGAEPFNLKVIQPEGVKGGLAGWAAEVTRQDFVLGKGGVIGHAIIHSKVIVIDPFTQGIVVTGSHNFSATASGKNDENLLIFRGNRPLAERYAVNVMGVYQHYRWRSYLQECMRKKIEPWDGLKKSDKWQGMSAERGRELSFWLRAPV